MLKMKKKLNKKSAFEVHSKQPHLLKKLQKKKIGKNSPSKDLKCKHINLKKWKIAAFKVYNM